MTPKQAKKIADKVKDKRFGLLSENGIGVWIYECKTEQAFGCDCHSKRFRGCYDDLGGRWKKHIYRGKDDWEGFFLDSELYRTDYKVSIISSRVLDALLADKSK
jgi:hypothetical protein